MLSFASAPGNLFNALGKCALLIKQAASFQASQNTNFTSLSAGLFGQLTSQPDIAALVGSTYISSLNAAGDAAGNPAQQIAQQIINRLVYQDTPQPNQNLTTLNVLASINEVILQMKSQNASILAMTIGATPSALTGTGNGILVASTKRPVDGLVLENSFAETITVTCSSDSYVGGATAGNESFVANGAGAEPDLFAFDWPLGSGSTQSLSAIDGSKDNSSGNLLTNSGFETWTSNVPDKWSLEVGTAGTNIQQQSSILYQGSSSLQLVGDGSTLTALSQTFNSSTGTAGTLSPLSQYAVNLFMRRDGTAAAAGTLVVELVNSGGAVINDANGVANSFNIDLTTLSTNWTAFNLPIRTPLIMPSAYKLRWRLSTALSSGRSVYMDKVAFGPMTQIYVGGPFLAVFSGSNNFIAGDYFTCAVTNSRGAAGTLSTWQTALFRLLAPFSVQNEILWPSSSSPTISDSLIG